MARVNTFLQGQMSRYRVTSGVVACTLTNGSTVYVYNGSRLPINASPAQVEHLLSIGHVKEESGK